MLFNATPLLFCSIESSFLKWIFQPQHFMIKYNIIFRMQVIKLLSIYIIGKEYFYVIKQAYFVEKTGLHELQMFFRKDPKPNCIDWRWYWLCYFVVYVLRSTYHVRFISLVLPTQYANQHVSIQLLHRTMTF